MCVCVLASPVDKSLHHRRLTSAYNLMPDNYGLFKLIAPFSSDGLVEWRCNEGREGGRDKVLRVRRRSPTHFQMKVYMNI